MFKVNYKNTRTTSLTLFWCFYCCLQLHFTPFSSVCIAESEQVKVNKDLFNTQLTNVIHLSFLSCKYTQTRLIGIWGFRENLLSCNPQNLSFFFLSAASKSIPNFWVAFSSYFRELFTVNWLKLNNSTFENISCSV